MKLFFYSILIFWAGTSYAQEKLEKETRIHEDLVPNEAIVWLNEVYPLSLKVKWFAEQSNHIQSIEAKFKYNNHKHSVEFDSSGNFEDVEIVITQAEIDKKTYGKISEYFSSTYKKVNIIKIQLQIKGSKDFIKKAILANELSKVANGYEIEYTAKADKKVLLWEAFFDNDGKLVSKQKVIVSSSDNLIY